MFDYLLYGCVCVCEYVGVWESERVCVCACEYEVKIIAKCISMKNKKERE